MKCTSQRPIQNCRILNTRNLVAARQNQLTTRLGEIPSHLFSAPNARIQGSFVPSPSDCEEGKDIIVFSKEINPEGFMVEEGYSFTLHSTIPRKNFLTISGVAFGPINFDGTVEAVEEKTAEFLSTIGIYAFSFIKTHVGGSFAVQLSRQIIDDELADDFLLAFARHAAPTFSVYQFWANKTADPFISRILQVAPHESQYPSCLR